MISNEIQTRSEYLKFYMLIEKTFILRIGTFLSDNESIKNALYLDSFGVSKIKNLKVIK